MKKIFFKPLLVIVSIGLLSMSVAGCQTNISFSQGQQHVPNYLKVAADYQDFLGNNASQALVMQQQMNKQLQASLPASLIPASVWKYLDNNLLTPNQLEEIWPGIVALKQATAKYPAFSDENIQKLVNKDRETQKLAPVEYSSDTIAFFRLLLLKNVAQQTGMSPTELQAITMTFQKAQPKAPKFGIGSMDQEISTLISEGTQKRFHIPVMKPQVAHGVLLQGYDESAQELLSRVQGGQK